MKISTAMSLLSVTLTSATTVTYDVGYDDKNRALTAVACSDGRNGLITRYGYQTQGSIPNSMYIGGSSDIAGWNSPSCGQCYSVAYKGKTIYILGIDRAGAGLNLSKGAMNALTSNQAEKLGRVDASVTKVSVSKCGLTPKRDGIPIELNA